MTVYALSSIGNQLQNFTIIQTFLFRKYKFSQGGGIVVARRSDPDHLENVQENTKKFKISNLKILMIQKGTTFDHDFYVFVGKQCRTENVYLGHQYNIFI